MRRGIALIAALAIPFLTIAQGQSEQSIEISSLSEPMTLEECIGYAVENSYKSNLQKSRAENSKIDYREAILAHTPSISGSAGLESAFGRGIDPETNSYANESSLSNSFRASGELPIFNGFRLLNQTRRAKIAKLKGEKEVEMVKDQVAEETMVAFAEVVYNGELVSLYNKRIENLMLEEKKMERMCQLGGGSQADLAQIKAKRAAEQYSAINAQNMYELSLIKLKDCMNYPLDDTLKIVQMIDSTELYNPMQSIGEIVNFAIENNPKSVVESQIFKAEQLSLSIAKGGYSPSLYLYGGISTAFFRQLNSNTYTAYGKQLENNLGEWVGISISIPIFNGNQRRYDVKRAKNNLNEANLTYNQNIRTLESEVRQAAMELDAARSAWIESKQNVAYQRLATEAIRKKYEQSAASIIDLQTSDNDLFRSEVELRNSYLRYQIKLREVNYYKGVSYF